MLLALPCVAHVVRRFRPVEALVIGLGRGEALVVAWGGRMPDLSGWQWSARWLTRTAAPNNEFTSRAVVGWGGWVGVGGTLRAMGGVMNSSEPSGRTKPACICRTGGAHASGHQREPDQGFVPCVCGSPGYAAHQREAEHRHRAYSSFRGR